MITAEQKILRLKTQLKTVETDVSTKADTEDVDAAIAEIDLSSKQDVLVSGTNIKTINSSSLLGSGDLVVGGGSFSGDMDDIPDGAVYVKTENNYDDTAVSKLAGIAAGAEVNVNADWNSGSGDSQILNKPTVPVASDVAYNATSWNANTDVPTKNAVRDKIETMDADITNVQNDLVNYARYFTEFIVNDEDVECTQNSMVFVNMAGGNGDRTVLYNTSNTAIVFVRIINIPVGETCTLYFQGQLNGSDPDIVLGDTDNGSTMQFIFSPTLGYWYQTL